MFGGPPFGIFLAAGLFPFVGPWVSTSISMIEIMLISRHYRIVIVLILNGYIIKAHRKTAGFKV